MFVTQFREEVELINRKIRQKNQSMNKMEESNTT